MKQMKNLNKISLKNFDFKKIDNTITELNEFKTAAFDIVNRLSDEWILCEFKDYTFDPWFKHYKKPEDFDLFSVNWMVKSESDPEVITWVFLSWKNKDYDYDKWDSFDEFQFTLPIDYFEGIIGKKIQKMKDFIKDKNEEIKQKAIQDKETQEAEWKEKREEHEKAEFLRLKKKFQK